MKEIQYREGRVQAPPAADRAAFDESIPLSEAHAPTVEQALKNFQLMEGSDATFVCKMAGNPYPNVSVADCLPGIVLHLHKFDFPK